MTGACPPLFPMFRRRMLRPPPPNRVLLLWTSINDKTAWPHWKLLELKKFIGAADMAVLAFTSKGGSFEARIGGDQCMLKSYANVTGYKQDMLERFISRWHDPGRSCFVYGGHGMGDYLDLEQGSTTLQIHELASILGKRQFEAIVFDACFMANLDCAYHLRHNTKYIGASEGYMWEPDHIFSRHIFNQQTAGIMSRVRDPRSMLEQVQKAYCRLSPFADFSVISTEVVEELRKYVQQCVIPRVYERASFYTSEQFHRLEVISEATLRRCESIYGRGLLGSDSAESQLMVPTPSLSLPKKHKLSNRAIKLQTAIQFEHSLYPSAVDDKHVVDLKSYIADMVSEEASVKRLTPPPPRTFNVNRQGSMPSSSLLSSSAIRKHITSSAPPADAKRGLELFERTVVSQRGPRAKPIYATRLGGLSLAIHKFSAFSKPAEPWTLAAEQKAAFNQKCKAFLNSGSLPQVTLPLQPQIARVLMQPSRKRNNKTVETLLEVASNLAASQLPIAEGVTVTLPVETPVPQAVQPLTIKRKKLPATNLQATGAQ